MMQRGTRCLVACCAALGIFLVAANAVAGQAKNVLVLYSNGRLVPGNVDVEAGLRSSITSSVERPVQVFTEFLDKPEFEGAAHERTVATYLRDKYAQHPPDIVLAVARESLDFVLRHRSTLFPGVVVVHTAVFATMQTPPSRLPADVVGVPVDYDIAGTIELALGWHPGTKRVLVVTGSTTRDREWEGLLRNTLGALSGRVDVEFLAGMPTDELFKRLREAGPDSVVYTPGFYQSGDGLNFTPRESVQAMAQLSAAPVYGPFSTFVGAGAIGGRAPSFEAMGRKAGEIVNSLLRGAAPGSLQLPSVMPTQLNVDLRQTRRWGIDDKDIPRDAVTQFRQPTFWETYRMAIIVGGSLILLQTTLIVAFMFEHRRRRKVEMTLVERGSELAHVSRLAIAGELTASIAHEINQPLGAILANAEAADLLIEAGRGGPEELRNILRDIRRDDLRASAVISRLRSLLSRQASDLKPFELNETVADGCELLLTEARRRAMTVVVRPSATPVHVVGDPVQIQQVIINLVLNAMDAIGDLPEPRRAIHVGITELARSVDLTVSDRGAGIADEHLPKLFDSFYSTKRRGMGIGLSITRTIVVAHGGRLWAESTLGAGTIFHVELPGLVDRTVPSQRQELT